MTRVEYAPNDQDMQCETGNLWSPLADLQSIASTTYNRVGRLPEEPLKSMALSFIFPFLGLKN